MRLEQFEALRDAWLALGHSSKRVPQFLQKVVQLFPDEPLEARLLGSEAGSLGSEAKSFGLKAGSFGLKARSLSSEAESFSSKTGWFSSKAGGLGSKAGGLGSEAKKSDPRCGWDLRRSGALPRRGPPGDSLRKERRRGPAGCGLRGPRPQLSLRREIPSPGPQPSCRAGCAYARGPRWRSAERPRRGRELRLLRTEPRDRCGRE